MLCSLSDSGEKWFNVSGNQGLINEDQKMMSLMYSKCSNLISIEYVIAKMEGKHFSSGKRTRINKCTRDIDPER